LTYVLPDLMAAIRELRSPALRPWVAIATTSSAVIFPDILVPDGGHLGFGPPHNQTATPPT
jgi:hypothetical protein